MLIINYLGAILRGYFWASVFPTAKTDYLSNATRFKKHFGRNKRHFIAYSTRFGECDLHRRNLCLYLCIIFKTKKDSFYYIV